MYNITKKITFITLLFLTTITHAADTPMRIDVRIVDTKTSYITITHPIKNRDVVLSILPTSYYEDTINYELIGAYGTDKKPRKFYNPEKGINDDAAIFLENTDTSVTAEYKVYSSVGVDKNFGLFIFPLLFGSDYSDNAIINITSPKHLQLVSFPNSENINTKKTNNVQTVIQTNVKFGGLAVKELVVTVIDKNKYKSTYINNKFNVYTNKSDKNSKKIISTFKELKDLDYYSNQILGVKMPPKIYAVVLPSTFFKNYRYEVTALQIGQNLIAISDAVYKDHAIEDIRTVIIHELAHIAMQKLDLFKGESYVMPWFNEGIAVFVEQYINDELKLSTNNNIYKKINLETLKKEYEFSMDYYIDKQDENQNAHQSYQRLGLVFYNLYLKNPNYIKDMLNNLKIYQASSCVSCNSKIVLDLLKYLTLLEEDDILYPYKSFIQSATLNDIKKHPELSKLLDLTHML